MREFINNRAQSLGFIEPFYMVPRSYDEWLKEVSKQGLELNLTHDAKKTYPDADCIILLVYPYKPFAENERISAYYLASNAAYFASKQLIEDITEKGKYAERARIPLKEAAVSEGIGVRGRNGLLRIGEYGSRIILHAIATDATAPQLIKAPYTKPCGECSACIKACPMQAITNEGVIAQKCLRYHMDDNQHPEFVYEKMCCFLGCETCMHACVQNKDIGTITPTSEIRNAFDLERLVVGDVSDAQRLVGKNIAKREKLMNEAWAFMKFKH